jgi:hypothetical protein
MTADVATLQDRISDAVEIAEEYGRIDGAHHKMWVIDQMVRVLLGERYAEWFEADGGEWWDQGVAP